MTKLGRDFVYMKRVFLEVFSQGFSPRRRPSMYDDQESCLDVHANLSSPNFDTQNSTQMFGITWQACKFG